MADTSQKPQFKGEYGTSANGNFTVTGTIPVTHPYCIGPKHVAIASDMFGGILGDAAIAAAEEQGYCCQMKIAGRFGVCGKRMAEHETALLITCKVELPDKGTPEHDELHKYLLACKPQAEQHKYAGFAFIKGK